MAEPVLFLFDASVEGKVLLPAMDSPEPPAVSTLDFFRELLIAYGGVSRHNEACDVWGELSPLVTLPPGFSLYSRRDLPMMFDYDFFTRAGVAYQMLNLTRKNRFCGVCGGLMRDHERERARECSLCGNLIYPTLSPAVIVAVEKEGRLLMGHNANFPQSRYSVLAGFVEPGETLEQTVAREIYEESRIRVKNIRYFGSQPWPFPASMMVGFRADWESGEPTPDGEELEDVRWFAPDDLPEMPSSVSISRQLIDDWLERQRNGSETSGCQESCDV